MFLELAAKHRECTMLAVQRGVISPPANKPDIAMHTYSEAFKLDMISAHNARISTNKRVARKLWKMAREYQAEAAKFDNGRMPDIGDPPQERDR
jgi:hypothetical protein